MPTPDFSKIFGSNATSTQNWSDGNYLTGWGFLGQAPPPYQLFDDYFKNTDTKLKWLYDNFGSIDVTTAINTHNSNIESHPKLNFNILKRNKAYSIGDIAYSSTIPSWVQLQCKTAGTTAASEPTWGTLVAGQEITDGTVVWVVYDVKGGDGISIGTIMPHLVTSIPAGWLDISTGAEISRITYSKMWEWVQANAPLISESAWQTKANAQSSVGAFSTGDGSTTFRLPRIVDYVRGGILADVGNWQEDMFKSHSHTYIKSYYTYNVTGGPTAKGNEAENDTTGATGGEETRPKTIKMVYCIKAFGSPTNQGLIDITSLANDVAGKQYILKHAVLNETQNSGVTGGTFTSGAWRTRVLNTIVSDDIGVTLSNNQFTLPAGKYCIIASAPALAVDRHKIQLQNITDSTTVAIGTSAYTNSAGYASTSSTLTTEVNISSAKAFEIQHRCQTTFASMGFGLATSFGVTEIYTQVYIEKVG